ncbi:hypothetical protein PQX77_004619 [Marasmius sp. AFHP31]|nr:hypothetical protein PQX77_004619 [Marasmius sp. AFHP31]
MLPTNPRAGLPTNPRSGGPGGRQNRREGSSRPEYGNDTSSSSRRSERSQRPTTPSGRDRSRGPRSHDRPPRRSNDSSSSSSSAASASSSLYERMKNGAAGYASSFTTVEDDSEEDDRKPVDRGNAREGMFFFLFHFCLLCLHAKISGNTANGAGSDGVGEGYGQAIWSRMATAAGSLTVSVSKAWATNITTYAGEETPPGQESRLTRAMKAYHLEKARDPTDLPAWLFDEHERRPRRSNPKERIVEDTSTDQREIKQSSATRSATPRGLRDVYDAVPSTVPIHQSSSGQASTVTRGAAKGTDRLKALREGKRGLVATPNAQPETGVERARAPPPRVGLPGGPGRNRRV